MKCLITFFLFVGVLTGIAQKKIISVEVTGEIIFAAVDRVGELYIITTNGHIQRFDANGKLLSVFRQPTSPTLFEPRDGSRLFAFYRKDRKYEYLNPSFEAHTVGKIDSAFVIDPWLACSSGDHDIWILDAADHTLKKVNVRTSTVPVDTELPQNIQDDFANISFLREYQSFLFFLDKKGIHIFNGMGKWIKTLALASLAYFNFLGEELYYPAGDKLVFINLFSGEQREMRISQPFKIALLTDERMFLIKKNTVDFLQFKP